MIITNQIIQNCSTVYNMYISPIVTVKRHISRGLPKFYLKSIVIYNNAKLQKINIFKDNINKSFVYRWVNKINGKDYLGSTSNARKRLSTYYDISSLNLVNMPIYKAILKYGHVNFSFEIVEYCEAKDVVNREQYYLDKFDFYYNILEKANSLLGFKHTTETLNKMKGRQSALGYRHSQNTLDRLRQYQTNRKHSIDNITKMRKLWAERKGINKIFSEVSELKTNSVIKPKNKGKLVLVKNIETNIIIEFKSISSAALSLNVQRSTLRNYINNKQVLHVLTKKGDYVQTVNYLVYFKDN